MMLYQEKKVKVIIMSDFKQKDRMRDHLSFTNLKSLQNDYIMEIYGMQIILEIKGKIRYTKREKRKQDRNLQEDFYEQKFKDNSDCVFVCGCCSIHRLFGSHFNAGAPAGAKCQRGAAFCDQHRQ